MARHDRDHPMMDAFLTGTLDSGGATRWDEHLLECEQCWRAVREDRAGHRAALRLRQSAPPWLADWVAFAVEVAAADITTRRLAVRRIVSRWRCRIGACCRALWAPAAYFAGEQRGRSRL